MLPHRFRFGDRTRVCQHSGSYSHDNETLGPIFPVLFRDKSHTAQPYC